MIIRTTTLLAIASGSVLASGAYADPPANVAGLSFDQRILAPQAERRDGSSIAAVDEEAIRDWQSLEETIRSLSSWEDAYGGARSYRPTNFIIRGVVGSPAPLGQGGVAYASPQLRIGGNLQARYVGNFRDDSGSVDEEFTHGFESHRNRILWEADLTDRIGARLTFNFGSLSNGAPTGESGDDLEVEDAYVGWRFGDNVYIKWGQFKPDFMTEESVDDAFQLLVDRSPVAEYLGQQWTEGVQLTWEGERVRVSGLLADGFGTWRSGYESPEESDILFGGRVDVRLGDADWSQYGDFTSFRDDDFGVRFGAGVYYQLDGETNSSSPTDDLGRLDFTADAQIEGAGWNLGAALTGMHVEYEEGPIDDLFSLAFAIQGGVFVTDQVELAGRFSALLPDEDSVSGDEDEFYFAEFGLNYYFVPNSHALKLSIDGIYAFNETAPLTSLTNNNGVRPAGAGSFTGLLGSEDDGEFALRAQISVLF